MRRNSIVINGVSITTNGSSVSIVGGRVLVDGKDVTPDAKTINIEVRGDLDRLEADACEKITVSGNAGAVSTQSGDVECGPVTGSVKTMSGDVTCGNIGGSVQTMSGDVRCTGACDASSMSGKIRRV